MRSVPIFLTLIAFSAASSVHAQDITGIWQGATGTQKHVLKITKTHGGFRGDFFNLGPEAPDDTLNGNSISSIVMQGRAVEFALDNSPGSYDGTLSTDGSSISGNWQTSGKSQQLTLVRAKKSDAWAIDPSPHKTQFVAVDKDVKLEVLDWGGNGPPLVFLAGLGNTAHVFDELAPKFADKHHVYGITRRGVGLSTWPPPNNKNYDPDRLGDDVLKVIDALKLDRPILAGHSIAGQELSSIGTRHPEKVAALIYLDAALSFAYYDPDENTLQVDIPTLRRDLEQLPKSAGSPSESIKLMNEMEATFPNLQKAFAQYRAMLAGLPELPPRPSTLQAQVQDAVVNNARRYTSIEPPILAIFAAPRQCTPNCGTPGNDAQQASVVAQANAFAAGNPSAHVVRLAYANHYLFRSNEADVIREMNAFMEGLPKGN